MILKAYAIQNGNASIMWYRFRNTDGKRYMANCENTLTIFYTIWQNRKRQRYWKGTFNLTDHVHMMMISNPPKTLPPR